MDGARGLVEILAELAGTAVAHERVERVVGEGAAATPLSAAAPAHCARKRRRSTPMRLRFRDPACFMSCSWSYPLAGHLACHRHAAKGSLSAPSPMPWLGRVAGKFMARISAP